MGANDVLKDAYPGPYAAVIDMRATEDVTDGLVIEGVAPGIIAAALAPAFFFGEALADGFTRFGMDQVKPRLLDAKAMGEAVQDDPGSIGRVDLQRTDGAHADLSGDERRRFGWLSHSMKTGLPSIGPRPANSAPSGATTIAHAEAAAQSMRSISPIPCGAIRSAS